MSASEPNDNQFDAAADALIVECLSLKEPVSFFLFAGAGSGKTRSLVEALKSIRTRHGEQLRLRGQQIAVITYTNNATDEIVRRLDFDPLVHVSTIHSFIWTLIQGFNTDIREWMKQYLNEEIQELEEAQRKGRAGSQAAQDRAEKIISTQKRLGYLNKIRKFTYSPTGNNNTSESLSHPEVIKLGAYFLTSKPLMQDLLVCKFPVLLIDESQDTNKTLMDAFFVVQAAQRKRFALGIFGDTMQRIYSDGKSDLGDPLPNDWKKPAKVMNHRCPKRVLKLINKIRSEVDNQQQRARTDAKEGWARLFVAPSSVTDKQRLESIVREKMAELTQDEAWKNPKEVKTLILEHHMAAKRLGFLEMYEPLYRVNEFRTGLRDGTLPVLRFFTDAIYPLVKAKISNDDFAAMSVIRKYSNLLTEEALKASGEDQMKQLALAQEAVKALIALFDNSAEPTFGDVLRLVFEKNLFPIPESLVPFTNKPKAPDDRDDKDDNDQDSSKTLIALRAFLDTRFPQIAIYKDYAVDETQFATHQGIKGLEFPRVLVVMDDEDAGGFAFSFEKLFNAKTATTTSKKNQNDDKGSTIDRTRRLFYVTCSRAQQSLAILAYSGAPASVASSASQRGWFSTEEIETINL
jgi:ATP-dependent DNA helicase UvrD/PcrA